MTQDPCSFDIDVDLSPLFGEVDEPTLISSTWYELTQNRRGRPPELQDKFERTFRNALLRAQWRATSRRRLDRRRAVRHTDIRRADDGALLAEADTEWVWVDAVRGRPVAVPEAVRSAFEVAPAD